MNNKIRTKAVEELFEAILTLRNVDECFMFFEDICTTNEILSFAQRYQVASMLDKKLTYQDIADQSGASTATISRVKRSMGDEDGGYQLVFKRLKNEE